MLFALDRWLIGKFEAFAHWFQRWTGKTNFFLALVAASIGYAMIAFFAWKQGNLFIAGWFFVASVINVADLSWLEKNTARRLESRTANPRKHSRYCFFSRISWLFFALFLYIPDFLFLFFGQLHLNSFVTDAAILCIVFYEYFPAGAPLPPGTSKVREWLESFGRKPVPISSRS